MAKSITLEYPYSVNGGDEPGAARSVAFADFPQEGQVPEDSVPAKYAQELLEQAVSDLLNQQRPFPVPSAPMGRAVIRISIQIRL